MALNIDSAFLNDIMHVTQTVSLAGDILLRTKKGRTRVFFCCATSPSLQNTGGCGYHMSSAFRPIHTSLIRQER
jgi:hypothetical protein